MTVFIGRVLLGMERGRKKERYAYGYIYEFHGVIELKVLRRRNIKKMICIFNDGKYDREARENGG
jgi:hypothetical protein